MADPHGKRLLFEGVRHMTYMTLKSFQAISAVWEELPRRYVQVGLEVCRALRA